MAAFADRLRKAREQRKLTTRQLAKLAGVDHAWINRLETGTKQNPSVHTVLRLADALHVSMDWLLGRYGYGSSGRRQQEDESINNIESDFLPAETAIA